MPNAENHGDPCRTSPVDTSLGLRFLFIVIPVTVVLGWVVLVAHARIAGPLMWLLSIFAVPPLITLIVYGNSYQRSFAIGAIFPAAVQALMLPAVRIESQPYGKLV